MAIFFHSSGIGCSKKHEFICAETWLSLFIKYLCQSLHMPFPQSYTWPMSHIPNLNDSTLVINVISSKITCLQRCPLILIPNTFLILSPEVSLPHCSHNLSIPEVNEGRICIWNLTYIYSLPRVCWPFLPKAHSCSRPPVCQKSMLRTLKKAIVNCSWQRNGHSSNLSGYSTCGQFPVEGS